MEKKLIKINNKWESEGSTVFILEPIIFIFWKLPFFVNKKYSIAFIGSDCSCIIKRKQISKVIIGSVNIFNL